MTDIIILAAGKGTRMKSDVTKVLNKILGRPMIHYLLDSIATAGVHNKLIVIVSPENQKDVKKSLENYDCEFVVQKELLGTGNAATSVFEGNVDLGDNLIVLAGDQPLISSKTIKNLNEVHQSSHSLITMITAKVPEYKGVYEYFYDNGRIKRNSDNEIVGIIEKTNTSCEEKKIREINPSLYIFNTKWLRENIGRIKMNEIKKEYYLTDIIEIAAEQGHKINSITVDAKECFGVNTQEQLRQIEDLISQER